jgi:3-hydroxybutyryl-CoA dehydrogenase
VSQPRPFETLGIVGSGTIATGLARLASDHGDVVLWARSDASARRATTVIEDAAAVVTELEALRESTLVIEAVAEDIKVKRGLLQILDDVLPDEVPVGTTTSALPVQELAEASRRPDRFAGVHFFNPVDRMSLVELCFPREASDETRERFRAVCEHLEKTVVEVPDVPGFVVNRLLFPYLFDAVRLMETTQLEPDGVDACMKLGAGHPVGPLKLLDFVGLDVAVAIGEAIGVEVPETVRRLESEGRLGKKSGWGFYQYDR